jgi:YbbR domain-containing protein
MLRNLVFRDFWLKLFSLTLAILIWQTVSFAIRKEVMPVGTRGAATSERTFFSVPIVALSTDVDVREFRMRPAEVEITVRGETRLLEELQSRDIRAVVDLTGLDLTQDVRRRVEVIAPIGVTHMRVAPEEVQVIAPPAKRQATPGA